ncbi:MAG: GNAT family N-acetyltransferase [Deltaproteobacteria bacterium]|nr:GNAT family N-acetyltransferase [Deltaproteobacteria bacterium]
MRYGPAYEEQVVLRDGSRALVRTVRPEDKGLLREGFDRLSPESRYRRFLGAKQRLSDAELRYLTEVDGTSHFAIGALRRVGNDGHSHDEGLGIARFIRLPEDPDVAEAAIAVVDTAQGQGLGSLLLRRLVEAAVERGVRHFRCVVLASNDPMRHILESLGLEVRESHDGDLLLVDVPLPDSLPLETEVAPSTDEGAPWKSTFEALLRLLRLAAEGILAIRGRVSVLGLGGDEEAALGEADAARDEPGDGAG